MAMGVMPFFNPRSAFNFSFLQAATPDTADLTTYTFASQNIGAPASDRLVIVAYSSANSNGTGVGLTSVTIGGITATTAHSAGTNVNAGLAWAVVPTGTTASIVLTFAIGQTSCKAAVYRLSGQQSSTAFDTDAPAGGASAARAVSIDVPAGGCVIASAGDAATSMTWTGATEDQDSSVETTTGSSASKTSATAITPETITATSCRAIAAVSFR